MLKNWSWKETGQSLRPKICLLRQSWTKYLEQSSKTGQEKKSLVSIFACF